MFSHSNQLPLPFENETKAFTVALLAVESRLNLDPIIQILEKGGEIGNVDRFFSRHVYVLPKRALSESDSAYWLSRVVATLMRVRGMRPIANREMIYRCA
jgi:hypothetical protein